MTESIQNQQDRIIGKLTRELEFEKETNFKTSQSRNNRKRQAGYSQTESFDKVWQDMMNLKTYMWEQFKQRAEEDTESNYDDKELLNQFNMMVQTGDYNNIDSYIEEAQLPF